MGKRLIILKNRLFFPFIRLRNQRIENKRAEKIGHKILAKKKALEDERLVLEREEKPTFYIDSQLKELYRVLGCLVIMFLTTLTWAESSIKIEDRTVSGSRVNIEKVGSNYGIYSLTGKRYMLCNKDDDASPNYYGYQAADGSWFILKETVSAGADTYQYDSGTSSYSTNWTNRATLSYQNWGDEM